MSAPGVVGYEALGQDVNKVKESGRETQEGIVSEKLPELSLDMKDEELLDLAKKWQKSWAPYGATLKKRQDDNEEYWMGKQKLNETFEMKKDDRPKPDNLIFEATETLLPVATQAEPEPLAESDNTDDGTALADRVTKMLGYLSKKLDMKLTLKSVLRNWNLYFLGVAKVGWSEVNKEIAVKSLRPQTLILDPDATIVNGNYTGSFIGEIRKDTASNLVLRFPSKKKAIKEMVGEKMGTELNYTEWWTDDFLFWTYKDLVLDKVKNPHWNYETENIQTDEFGNQTPQKIPGNNHLPKASKPYVFLSVFNLGQHPFDDTNLVHQNIGLQNMISKRLRQIDINADNCNGGAVVNGECFTKEQAALVGKAKREGNTVWVPPGAGDNLANAYRQDIGPPLPPFIYQSLMDYRAELKNNFGISGLASGGTRDRTAKGQMVRRQHDIDRIGGGISEYLEQFAEQVFNWMVQLMYVYYDEQHAASVIGAERAQQYITLKSSDMTHALTVQVREGSTIPKDPMIMRTEALELWRMGALGPIELFTKLEFPNPRETAKQMFIWNMVKSGMMPPQMMFPDLQVPPQPQQTQQPGAAQQPPQAAPAPVQ